jgi:RNA polymerase sigma-70 factor, ECF subfamily
MPERSDESDDLVDAYPRILRYVGSIVRNSAEAEDLTQETFLRAYRAREALRDPQAQMTWLYRIATRVCLDRMRQRTRRPVEADATVEEVDLADPDPPLQQVIEQDDMSACVQAYVANLPDSYRAVLLLNDLHELTAPQIAALLDISLPTVKIRLHRARRKLRATLEGGCVFSHDERNVFVCEPRTG